MGLLDKLWDDVVAGPQPEKGLSKLRQRQGGVTEGLESVLSMVESRRRSGELHRSEKEARRFTQNISIKRPPLLQTSFDYNDSPVSSPAASSPMESPGELDWSGNSHSREREHLAQRLSPRPQQRNEDNGFQSEISDRVRLGGHLCAGQVKTGRDADYALRTSTALMLGKLSFVRAISVDLL